MLKLVYGSFQINAYGMLPIIHGKEAPIMSYKVNFLRDCEANVWVATSEDVPGLVLESESFDDLLQKVGDAIPELIQLNSDNDNVISFPSVIQPQKWEATIAYG